MKTLAVLSLCVVIAFTVPAPYFEFPGLKEFDQVKNSEVRVFKKTGPFEATSIEDYFGEKSPYSENDEDLIEHRYCVDNIAAPNGTTFSCAYTLGLWIEKKKVSYHCLAASAVRILTKKEADLLVNPGYCVIMGPKYPARIVIRRQLKTALDAIPDAGN